MRRNAPKKKRGGFRQMRRRFCRFTAEEHLKRLFLSLAKLFQAATQALPLSISVNLPLRLRMRVTSHYCHTLTATNRRTSCKLSY